MSGEREMGSIFRGNFEGPLFGSLIDNMNQGLEPILYGSHRSDLINRNLRTQNTIDSHYHAWFLAEYWYELGKTSRLKENLPDI